MQVLETLYRRPPRGLGTVSDLHCTCTPQQSMPQLYSQFAEALFGQCKTHEPNKQTLAKPSLFLHLLSQATVGEAV